MSVTGFASAHLPDSPEKDEILSMVKTVTTWRANQCGRRPGAVHHYLCAVAEGLGDDLSFSRLVLELRYRLLLRNDADNLLDDVDTATETVTWCEPGKPCYTMPFSTLANKWTKARKIKLSKLSR